MRFWYVNNDRERIFDHTSLILFFAVIIAVLIWLFPQQSVFRQQLPANEVDAVSIAYLELLLKTVPEDIPLRMNLISQLIQTGQYKSALRRLNVLLVNYPLEHVNSIDLLQLQILAQLSFSNTVLEQQKLAYQATVNKLLQAMRGRDYTPEERQTIAEIALGVGKPQYAARQYAYLANIDADNEEQWLRLAAKWYVAAGEHEGVAGIYERLAKSEPKRYLKKAIDTYLMLEQRAKALDLYSEYLTRVGYDADMLAGATRLAIGLDKPRARQYLQHMIITLADDPAAMQEARELALALGDLEIALFAAQNVSRLAPKNWREREKLARIYEWNSKPQEALKEWRKLIRQRPTEQNLQHTRHLAMALYDFKTVLYILTTTGKRRALNEEELSLLVFSYEERGDPRAGVEYLQAYVQTQPRQREAWVNIAYLQERMQDVQGALATWKDVQQRFDLTLQESQTLAGLQWSLNDTNGALATLLKVKSLANEGDETYWRLLAQIAWQEEEDMIAMQALKRAINSPADVSQQEADILLLIADENSTDLQIKVAQKSWERFRQSRYLIALMQMSQALQRWDEMELALDEAQGYRYLFAENVQYWLLKAAFAEHHGRADQAQNAYLTALRLSGDGSDVVQSFLWFLINNNQQETLAVSLHKWAGLTQQDASLWPVFAAATSRLGRYPEALRWYQLLVEDDPENINTLIGYADTLQIAGRAPAAWRLRKHIFTKMNDDKSFATASGELLTQQLDLTQSLAGYRRTNAHLQQTRRQAGDRRWLPIHNDRLIASGNADAVNFWRMWLQQESRHELPVLQRMAMAQHNYERDAMLELLDHEAIIPATRATTLQRLGWKSHSLAVGLDALESQPLESEQRNLRELLTQTVNGRPSGVRIDWKTDQLGGIDLEGPEFRWAQYYNNWHSQVEIQQAGYSSDELADFSGVGEETIVGWRWLRDVRHGSWSLQSLASWRDDQSVFGLQGEYERRWDSHFSTRVSASWQDLPTVTPILRAFGVYDHANVNLNYTFTARDTLSAELGLNRYQARVSGEAFASGYDASINYFHRLNFADPEWSVNVGVAWQGNAVDERIPADISDRLRDSNTTSDTILPEEYGQVFIGTTLQHGDLHAVNARAPSPRYLFNLSVAYQWPQEQISFGASVGLGWRIVGNDELAFTYGYNSKPLGGLGKAAEDIRLSYSYRFGR